MWTRPYAVLLLIYSSKFIFMSAAFCHLCSCLPFWCSTVESQDFNHSIHYSCFRVFRSEAIRDKVDKIRLSYLTKTSNFSEPSPRGCFHVHYLSQTLLLTTISAFVSRVTSVWEKIAYATWTSECGAKTIRGKKVRTKQKYKTHKHGYKAVPEFLLGVPTFYFKGRTGVHTLCLFKWKKDEAKLHSRVFSSPRPTYLPCPS